MSQGPLPHQCVAHPMFGAIVCVSDSIDDKNVPTLVEGLVRHKVVQVDCGSDDAHTLALENNG